MIILLSHSVRYCARLLAAATVCVFAACTMTAPATSQTAAPNTTVVLDKRHFDLAKRDDLTAFIQKVRDLRALSKEERKEEKADKKAEKKAEKKSEKRVKKKERDGEQPAAEKPSEKATTNTAATPEEPEGQRVAEGSEGTQTGKRRSGRDWSDKKVRLCLETMERIAKGVQDGAVDSAVGIHDVREVDWALEHSFVTPYVWRKSVDPLADLFRMRDITLNACGRGNRSEPASNLLTYTATDLSLVDPKPSTFWSRPASIAGIDLYAGFNRKTIPDFTDSICTYDGPHKGYGVHPSFEVEWHKTKWKVKFGEECSSGPFACRIFWALGFPVEIVDYTPQVRVRWDRRILSDFNSHKLNAIQVRLLGLPIESLHQTSYFDPFNFITSAVLKDGTRVGAQELRARLFPTPKGEVMPKHPESNPALYDTAFESRIDYLVMKEASVLSKEKENAQELGFWDYNSADNPMRREVRAMAVLNAWLDNWDIRWGNNALDLVTNSDGSYRIEHMVSDLGALFGNSSGMIRRVNGRLKIGQYQNAPNDYEWAFTHSQKPGYTSVPIRDYMPVTKTMPFYLMNLDDARWMARLIAQLTEDQIKQALIGAGYDGVEARLLLEKLVARRDQMVKDFGLSGEIALLRPNGVNRKLTYNPAADAPFAAVCASGLRVAARETGAYILIDGVLKPTRKSNQKSNQAVASRR